MPALLLALLVSGVAASPRGAIATAHPLASEAGAAVLRAGGNAVDAAVAAAFALSVVENQRSGIGGGGFALVWVAREGKVHALDFREVAPAAATRDMFVRGGEPDPRLAQAGGLAVAVPGAVKGYAELARRFGTRPLRELVEPAARIADGGFHVGLTTHQNAQGELACLRADAASAREFLVPGADGARIAPAPGDRLVRRDLARTLRLLGAEPDAFYRGPLARRIAAAVRAAGGILSEADLAAYRVREREPLRGTYRGHRIAAMPPPSAGGAIVIGLLQALEAGPPPDGWRAEPFLHRLVELERRLFERRAALGDPAFAEGAAAAARELASAELARSLAAEVGARATPSAGAGPRPGGGTAHVSAVDADGNAVALTTTVNGYYGACLVVPGTGILLNDQMDDFETAPGVPNQYGLVGTGANAVAPGKVPLSSMSPTLVFAPDGRLLLALGATGGSTIPSTVAQVIANVLDHGMRLDDALAAPKIHHQWLPDRIDAEPWALDAATEAALRARGHAVETRARPFGNPQAVMIDPRTGWRIGASDPRWDGAPAAP
ncbi:MAG TPA: gamma-glutamyltransferase [Anaeromyxobacter sp.]|nr:gamma-glutamyltransferase [Anaeromyxobacter sp.]